MFKYNELVLINLSNKKEFFFEKNKKFFLNEKYDYIEFDKKNQILIFYDKIINSVELGDIFYVENNKFVVYFNNYNYLFINKIINNNYYYILNKLIISFSKIIFLLFFLFTAFFYEKKIKKNDYLISKFYLQKNILNNYNKSIQKAFFIKNDGSDNYSEKKTQNFLKKTNEIRKNKKKIFEKKYNKKGDLDNEFEFFKKITSK